MLIYIIIDEVVVIQKQCQFCKIVHQVGPWGRQGEVCMNLHAYLCTYIVSQEGFCSMLWFEARGKKKGNKNSRTYFIFYLSYRCYLLLIIEMPTWMIIAVTFPHYYCITIWVMCVNWRIDQAGKMFPSQIIWDKKHIMSSQEIVFCSNHCKVYMIYMYACIYIEGYVSHLSVL